MNPTYIILAPIPQVRDWPMYGKVMQQVGLSRMSHPGQMADMSKPTARDWLDTQYKTAETEMQRRLDAMAECKSVMSKLSADIDALTEAFPFVASKLLKKELMTEDEPKQATQVVSQKQETVIKENR